MRRPNAIRISLLSSALLVGTLLLATTGCGTDTIRIGAILPETGGLESYGSATRNGIEVALAEIQADTEYPIELEVVFFDSGSDPDVAAEQLEGVYRDGVNVAIGGVGTDEAKAMVPIADNLDRILISPSASSPDLTDISTNFFRVYPSDFLEANKMAMFAKENLDLEQVVIIAEELDYARGIQSVFKQEFERRGGEISEVVEFPPNTKDFSGIVEFVTGLRPAGLYIAGYDLGVAELIRALRDAGYEGKILTVAAFATPRAMELAGDAAVGALLTKVVFEVDSEHAHIKSFVEAYEALHGEKPDLFAAHGYDAMKLVADAIKGRTQITSELLKGLRGIKDFPGVTGSIQFDEKGDVQKFPRVYLVSKDLTLYNYDAHVAEQRKQIEERRKALEDRLRRIQNEADSIGG